MSDTPAPILKRITDTAIGMAMYGPIALAKILPYHLRIPFMGWLTARVIAPIAGYDKRVRDNLAHVLPDLPEAEVRRLMRAVPNNAGRNMAELYSTPEFIARTRKSRVYGPGVEAIRAAQAEGRPIIFVTGHFGSFNAARIAMIEQGFEMGVFYRPMANKWFNTRYIAAMAALSQPMFEQGRRGMMQMVKHLRGGGVLAILTDLNAHDGVPLDFFGKPALSPLATAELALKFNAPLVPTWGIRSENGLDFEILVEEPVEPSDPVTMTQEVNDRLERQVRERMDQWFWIHRRWKDGTGPMADRGAKQLADRQDT
ncbi:Phosphatidylinositol mannoside acyltransferase [Roseovarius gaetbuli]|uniref:Phosphatidylinositol mannoside acyltransferase n=1 Tax=Roseovarius gaetbuli TaxID=1356575 RepID=A0A1X6YNP9_9RHOB|nr:lysophospholipid acyltransferase family protein [Roseovarius gaetbuli]SLN26834.1 Phosphatidylinositol mannoside acyltransferase [Roseovarius gaetbuli]